LQTRSLACSQIVRHLWDRAIQHSLSCQPEALNHGATDASLIQRLRAGVAVVTLSVPARYIHTVNETVAITDVDNSVTLLARYLEDAHNREYTAD